MLDDYMEMKARLDQLEEKVDRLLQWGLVDSVDVDAARLVVDLGGLKSMPLPWAVQSGRAWIPPVAGEQCLLVAPHGEMLQGVVLVGISKKDEGRGDKDIIDGALEHDRASGEVGVGPEPSDWGALAQKVDDMGAALLNLIETHIHTVSTTGSATAQTGTTAVTTSTTTLQPTRAEKVKLT